jgi:hypothetical protein
MLRPWYYYAGALVAACALYMLLRTGGPLLVAAWLLIDAALRRREAQDSPHARRDRRIHLPTGTLPIRYRLYRATACAGGVVVWSVAIARLQKIGFIPDSDFVASIWLVGTSALALMTGWHGAMALTRYAQGER